MKDLGEVNGILDINIIESENGYIMSQSHYAENFLRKFNNYDVTMAKTLYDFSVKLKKSRGVCISRRIFQSYWKSYVLNEVY